MRCGPLPFITKVEEEGLATWLIERAKRGFGLTVAELLDSAERFLDKDNRETPFKENRPGWKWCRLSNKPAHIWNCNKSASNLESKAGKVLGLSVPRAQPYQVLAGTKKHITVLLCFNVACEVQTYFRSLLLSLRKLTSANPSSKTISVT